MVVVVVVVVVVIGGGGIGSSRSSCCSSGSDVEGVMPLLLLLLVLLRLQPLLRYYRLDGLVVTASASRAEGPGFESRLRRDFFGVESYQ